MEQIARPALQGCHRLQPSCAFPAAPVVKAEKSQAESVAGLGESDLLGRTAVAQQPVAADDDRRVVGCGKMQRPLELEPIRGKLNVRGGRAV